MPRITVFTNTHLRPDYSVLVPNIGYYIEMIMRDNDYAIIDVPELVGGADTLKVQFYTTVGQGTRFKNASSIDYADVGGVYYFVESTEKISENVYELTLALDLWHNQTTLKVTGTMVSAHDMIDHVSGLRPALRFPVAPTMGDFIGSTNIFDDKLCCAVGRFTIFKDDIEQDIIIMSQPELSFSQGMIGAVNIMARTTHINPYYQPDTEGTAYEVKSVNDIYIVPSSLLRLPSTVNAAVVFAGTGSQQDLVAYCYYRDDNSVNIVDVNDTVTAVDDMPVFTAIGNHGSNITMDVVTTSRHAHIVVSYNGIAGTLSIDLRVNGQQIDLLPSMTASYSAARINERETAYNLNKVTRVASAAVSTVGGIMQLDAVGAAQSSIALTSGIIDNSLQTRSQVTSRDGQFMTNSRGMTPSGVFDNLPAIGIMRYCAANNDIVKGALEAFGYTGRADLVSFDLRRYYVAASNDPSFEYTAIYRRFDETFMSIDCDFMPAKSRPVLETLLRRGVTIYNAGNVAGDDGVDLRRLQKPRINWSITR